MKCIDDATGESARRRHQASSQAAFFWHAHWHVLSNEQVAASKVETPMGDRNGTADTNISQLEFGAFVRGLVHELANPLNTVLMNTELARLQLDRKGANGARDALDRAVAGCTHLVELLESQRRFGTGFSNVPPVRGSVRELIEAAAFSQLPAPPPFQVQGATSCSL